MRNESPRGGFRRLAAEPVVFPAKSRIRWRSNRVRRPQSAKPVVYRFETPTVVEWTDLGHSRRAGEALPVVSTLTLLGAVGFTLLAAYQWAGRLGIFGEATTLAPGDWQGHVWQGHVWNTVFAIILWLIWFYG